MTQRLGNPENFNSPPTTRELKRVYPVQEVYKAQSFVGDKKFNVSAIKWSRLHPWKHHGWMEYHNSLPQMLCLELLVDKSVTHSGQKCFLRFSWGRVKS